MDGQRQPLFAEMQRIIPGKEFVKGIPGNIEDEQFLNPAIQNLVIYDLMSEASNDKRICDLFTKGSHTTLFESDMSGAKFLLPEERKSHHKLEQSVLGTIQQLMGPATNHSVNVSRSECKVFLHLQNGYLQVFWLSFDRFKTRHSK